MRHRPNKESGFTLVLGLVFILVASMSAVTLMRGSVMQEQMTASLNNKAISYMAAETGANRLRAKLAETWPVNSAGLLGFSDSAGRNGSFEVTSITGGGLGSVLALVTGYAIQDGYVLGTTTIQVEFDRSGGLALPAAMTLAGNVIGFGYANSNKFDIDGVGAPDIATFTSESSAFVRGEVGGKGNGKGKEGADVNVELINSEEVSAPWNNAGQLVEFVESLRGLGENSPVNFVENNGKLDASKKVTIVEKGATLNGGLQGNIKTYSGIIIFLGETAVANGLGGTDIVGGIYVANPVRQQDGAYEFGDVSVDINGGGNASITYDETAGSSVLLPDVLGWREIL